MIDRNGSRRAAATKTLAGMAAAAGLETASYLALDRYARGLDSMPTLVMEEFPEIDEQLLEKFTSFDPELGWCPQPNQTKRKDTGDHLPGEEVRTVVTYSTDEYGSRVCTAHDRDPDVDVTVSTYGDSYCFCREVDDDETFQSHLARKLGTHVGNYGGGNYGIDQALMRLKRQYPEDPTDYVVMSVCAPSIARILSVWKHYQEFGNVLAVTPRYELDGGELRRVETPIDEKEDLLRLEAYADFLRSHDYHYEQWFEPHLASFPYAPEFLRDLDQVRYALYGAIKDLERRYETSVPGVDAGRRQMEVNRRLEHPRVKYHEELFDRKEDLFTAIVGEFVDYADEQGFTPVLAMLQHLRYVEYEEENGPVYGDLVERLDDRFPDLVTVDVGQRLSENGSMEELYVARGEGGHYSPEANERVADVLSEEVF